MRLECSVCCHHCRLEEGQAGLCHARRNAGGRIVADNYGKLTALALDPIEKKPLARFHPGSKILSVGSYGCNLRCPFCQNWEISLAGVSSATVEHRLGVMSLKYVSPREVCEAAQSLRSRGNIGVAYTYNEPLVGWEFVRDTAQLVHEAGMQNVLVSNGTASPDVLDALLPWVDAMNIDLKSFSEETYRNMLGGDLEMVKEFIRKAAESRKVHIELTTLIVPGMNDSDEEMKKISSWIAGLDGGRGKEIPLHVTRYFPRYHLHTPPAPVSRIYQLAAVARGQLRHVYTGNC